MGHAAGFIPLNCLVLDRVIIGMNNARALRCEPKRKPAAITADLQDLTVGQTLPRSRQPEIQGDSLVAHVPFQIIQEIVRVFHHGFRYRHDFAPF
jgi:hypothetical protein